MSDMVERLRAEANHLERGRGDDQTIAVMREAADELAGLRRRVEEAETQRDLLREDRDNLAKALQAASPPPPAEYRMPYESECGCPCHSTPGMMHIVACCQPDPPPPAAGDLRSLSAEALCASAGRRAHEAEDEARTGTATDALLLACAAHLHELAARLLERRASPPAAGENQDGVSLIAVERRRHVEQEGWTAEHDDGHTTGELAMAAAAYALIHTVRWPYAKDIWPWDEPRDMKIKEPVRNLARAGALIAAEIDRLRRRNGLAVESVAPPHPPAAADARALAERLRAWVRVTTHNDGLRKVLLDAAAMLDHAAPPAPAREAPFSGRPENGREPDGVDVEPWRVALEARHNTAHLSNAATRWKRIVDAVLRTASPPPAVPAAIVVDRPNLRCRVCGCSEWEDLGDAAPAASEGGDRP